MLSKVPGTSLASILWWVEISCSGWLSSHRARIWRKPWKKRWRQHCARHARSLTATTQLDEHDFRSLHGRWKRGARGVQVPLDFKMCYFFKFLVENCFSPSFLPAREESFQTFYFKRIATDTLLLRSLKWIFTTAAPCRKYPLAPWEKSFRRPWAAVKIRLKKRRRFHGWNRSHEGRRQHSGHGHRTSGNTFVWSQHTCAILVASGCENIITVLLLATFKQNVLQSSGAWIDSISWE